MTEYRWCEDCGRSQPVDHAHTEPLDHNRTGWGANRGWYGPKAETNLPPGWSKSLVDTDVTEIDRADLEGTE